MDTEVEQQRLLAECFPKIDATQFDEAFLVRNCLVHNGSRVSAALAKLTRRVSGEQISLKKVTVGPMLAPLRELADTLQVLSMYQLI